MLTTNIGMFIGKLNLMSVLVFPIVKPRDKATLFGAVKAWLPPGPRYNDILVGKIYDAGREIKLHWRLE